MQSENKIFIVRLCLFIDQNLNACPIATLTLPLFPVFSLSLSFYFLLFSLHLWFCICLSRVKYDNKHVFYALTALFAKETNNFCL